MNSLSDLYTKDFSCRLPDGREVVGRLENRANGYGFIKRPMLFKKLDKLTSVIVTHGPINSYDTTLLINKCASQLRGRIVVLSGTHGHEFGRTILDDGNQADPELYKRDKERLTGLILLNGIIIKVLNLADLREKGEFCRELEKLNPDTIVLNFCYGDIAMEHHLGREIRRVFGNLHNAH